jgi:hypothetical protein
MSHVTAILDAYPKDLGNIDREKLADAIEEQIGHIGGV